MLHTGCRLAMLQALLVGCGHGSSVTPSPVEVVGPPRDLRRMTGRWTGEFRSQDGERHGTISFDLAAASDTAYGTVTLELPAVPPACDPARGVTPAQVTAPIVLRIGALATEKGSVGGWMRPYQDPVTACWQDTWFQGFLLGDSLSGRYFTRPDTGGVRQGTWWAARRAR
jgi:hypothetical protein